MFRLNVYIQTIDVCIITMNGPGYTTLTMNWPQCGRHINHFNEIRRLDATMNIHGRLHHKKSGVYLCLEYKLYYISELESENPSLA